MDCRTSERREGHPRIKRRTKRETPVTPVSAPRIVAAFKRPDDTLCHGRCGRPLTFQGVRGLLEADFYCCTCLIHVTLPLAILDALPVASEPLAHEPAGIL